MSRDFRFSVLMSVYHKETPAFLHQAMASLFAQTLKADEFVLVADGPLTQELDEVIQRYATVHPELNIVRLAKNVGLGNALNEGMKHCTMPWIARADSDDVNDPTRFQRQIDRLREDPKIVVLGTDIDEFDQDPALPRHVKHMPTSNEQILQSIKTRNPINHMSVMFHRESIISVGSYQHLPYVEDYYLWARVAANQMKIENLGEVLVHARVGNGMVARRGNKAYIKSWSVLGKYMVSKGMITPMGFVKNMVLITGFVWMPVWLKSFVYQHILRR